MSEKVAQDDVGVVGAPVEDAVMAAIRRARPVPPEDRKRMLAALAECNADIGDPSQWLTDEQFQKVVARHPGAKEDAAIIRRAHAVMATVGTGAHSMADIQKVAQAIRDAIREHDERSWGDCV